MYNYQFKDKLFLYVFTAFISLFYLSVNAQEASKASVDIQAGSLKDGLEKLSSQVDQSIIYKAADLADKSTPALKGEYSVSEALDKLLAESGLSYKKSGQKSFVIVADKQEIPDPNPPAKNNLEDAGIQRNDFIITATRTEEKLESLSNSVTVLTKEDIKQAAAINKDLGSILGSRVPGLGTSTQSLSNSGQSLRGRNFSVLINGVPQSSPLRNVLRDLRTIDTAAIERIEIVRGATAIYGNGATGGIINIITKKNDEENSINGTSEVGLSFNTEHLDDSFGYFTNHQVNGRVEDFSYLINVAYQKRDGLYDGYGDRIPSNPQFQGGLDNSKDHNYLGRFSYDFTDDQILTLGINYYKYTQNSPYLATAGDISNKEFAQAVKADIPGDNPETKNITADLTYEDNDFFGSQLFVQAYGQDYKAVFPFDTNPIYGLLFPAAGGAQTVTESHKAGGRIQLTTPVEVNESTDLNFTYGVDYVRDKTTHDLSDRVFAPEMVQDSWGLFLQTELTLWDKLTIRGGVRHEDISVDVDSFNPLAYGLYGSTDIVDGGELDYSETLFNFGLSYQFNETYEAFISFSQGFSVTDVGGAIRALTPFDGVTSVEQFNPEAQKVDNYEIGARAHWDRVDASIAFFYSESDLGGSFTGSPDFDIVRAPEDIYGIEATVDWNINDFWFAGGTFTWQEGRTEQDDNSNEDIGSDRIAPVKITSYLENQTTDKWSNRLELLYSATRNEFDVVPNQANTFGQGDIDAFCTFNFVSSYQLTEKSSLSLGIENLFNERYAPVNAQAFNQDLTYTGGLGRTVTLTYSLTW